MNFASDNWAGVAPQINESLQAHATGFATAYGNSELDQKVKSRFSEIFEKEVAVFFVGTGTVANALAIASLSKPGGITLCHREAHMIEDECGAPELFSAGGRLVGVDGQSGKMDINDLSAKLDRFDPSFVHYGQPTAVSITQAGEAGTLYTLEEIQAISALTKSHNLPLHMDGSRFANALVQLDVTPAQMTWKSGVDILSFGGTKNGCWCAEAIVLFDPEKADQMAFIHKRAGQLYSKSRFIAAQYDAYFKDDLWLDLARHANTMADKMRKGIDASNNARHGWTTIGNEVFCILPQEKSELLKDKGASFHPAHIPHNMDKPPQKGEGLFRFVTSFATTEAEVTQMLQLLN